MDSIGLQGAFFTSQTVPQAYPTVNNNNNINQSIIVSYLLLLID